MNAGMKFKKLREQLGLTQLELSQKLKTTQINISRYENNKRNPTYKMLKKILQLAEKDGLPYTWDDFREYEEGGNEAKKSINKNEEN